MKAKTLLLFVSLVGAPAVCAFGQGICTGSNKLKLVCEIPTTSSTVAAAAIGATNAQSNQTIVDLSASINSSIGTQLTQLPIPSASAGSVSVLQGGIQVPFNDFGPLLTDRPDTLGKKGRLFLGFNYQRFNFNALDGIDLGAFPIGYVISLTTIPNDPQTLYGSESANIDFHLNQYVGVLTYGINSTTDLTVVVPFNDVSLNVTTSNFQTYLYDSKSNQYINESPTGSAANPIPTSGSASGVGDIVVSLKHLVLGQEGRPPALAVGLDFRVPSGDALNYLGSGAFGYNLHGLFEYRWKVSPHLKLGYQWNTASQLVDISNAPSTDLPGGLQYAAGADYSFFRKFTAAVDLLGSQFVNTKSASKFPQPLSPTPSSSTTGPAPATLPSISFAQNTYTTGSFSGGLKYHPGRHWLLYANVLVPIKNVGLRSDPVPMFGISYIIH